MVFDVEQTNTLIKLKSYLRMGGYLKEEKETDKPCKFKAFRV